MWWIQGNVLNYNISSRAPVSDVWVYNNGSDVREKLKKDKEFIRLYFLLYLVW